MDRITDRILEEQIIRALECCNRKSNGSCNNCPLYCPIQGRTTSCIKILILNAYYIVKDQKAEIEELKVKHAEVIKEFAERLKRVISDERFSRYGIEYEIDRIAKEMTEVQR